MIQKEVADRLIENPGGKKTGAITYCIYYYCESEKIIEVPKSSFIPEPKVTSEVIKLKIRIPKNFSFISYYQKVLLVLFFIISQTLKIEANEKRFENRSYHSRSHHHSDVPSSFRLPGKDSRHCKNRRQQDA